MKRIMLALVLAGTAICAHADSMEDARRLVTEGDYTEASAMLGNLVKSNPKLASTPLYLYLRGVCDFEAGEYKEAAKMLEAAKEKGQGAANLYLGRLAFLDYDFEKATELYGDFRRHREKANLVPGEDVEELERQLATAENALGRVEKVTVIDSIAVPAERFFEHYRLPRSAGRLLAPEDMPIDGHQDGAVVAYQNEGGDFMMWGEPDSVGNVRLVESNRLTDGTWQTPTVTPPVLNGDGYADYPFMMPDGVTLYYACDGNDSMGGYDIYVVTRDPQTGEYLQPQNIGMPYNSPYDDFMMAVDEENGVGWWATDRNLLGDKLTLYVYKVNDMRVNYGPDEEGLLSRARLSDYRATQQGTDAAEVSELLNRIDNINPEEGTGRPEFLFARAGGRYYKSLDDFGSNEARSAMKKYLMASASLAKEEKRLSALRKRYSVNHADNVKQQIIQFEKEIEAQRAELKHLRSAVYKAEGSTR